MAGEPWWIQKVRALLEPASLDGLALGPLWRLCERLQFVRENVEPQLLEHDFQSFPHSRATWAAFELRQTQARAATREAAARVVETLRSGALTPGDFRSGWEGLGFERNEDGAGTHADDYLDGLFEIERLTVGEARPDSGNLNVSSRAERVADFLRVTQPGTDDVVFDLGSGSGKLALTVAASCGAQVRGVEYGRSYVEASRLTADRLGLSNVGFVHGDVRDADLSAGSIFYLYFPFNGAVAQAVAETLGTLARARDITIYSSGPEASYGEHFLAQVTAGALVLSERRGEFGDTLVLRSARPSPG